MKIITIFFITALFSFLMIFLISFIILKNEKDKKKLKDDYKNSENKGITK